MQKCTPQRVKNMLKNTFLGIYKHSNQDTNWTETKFLFLSSLCRIKDDEFIWLERKDLRFNEILTQKLTDPSK